MIGYAATSAMSAIDGETMNKASLFSERPRERRRAGAPVATVAASMALEGAQRLRDLGVRLLDRSGERNRLLDRRVVVDVVADRGQAVLRRVGLLDLRRADELDELERGA